MFTQYWSQKYVCISPLPMINILPVQWCFFLHGYFFTVTLFFSNTLYTFSSFWYHHSPFSSFLLHTGSHFVQPCISLSFNSSLGIPIHSCSLFHFHPVYNITLLFTCPCSSYIQLHDLLFVWLWLYDLHLLPSPNTKLLHILIISFHSIKVLFTFPLHP